jgi:hypothetical protein
VSPKFHCSLLLSFLLCCALISEAAASEAEADAVSPEESRVCVSGAGCPEAPKTWVEDLTYSLKVPAHSPQKAEPPKGERKKRQMEYRQDVSGMKALIESPEWQQAVSDRRSFAMLARNYTNRITCEGTIQDVIYPRTKGIELELKNQGHDLFLRVGLEVPADITHYSVDLNIICDGEVFQINAAVDPEYPATNIELVLSGTSPQLRGHENSVLQASALPHEEKIAKIMRRVWKGDLMEYWKARTENKNFGSGFVFRQSVKTQIDSITAWDFTAPPGLDIPRLLAALTGKTSGEVIAIGRVPLRTVQRVVILTVERKKA